MYWTVVEHPYWCYKTPLKLSVNIMNNENVYAATGTKPWCETIKTRRLRWFGHVIRLPEDTPVKKALAYAKENYKRTKGRPLTTWISMMTKQLSSDCKLTWEERSM